jgi:nitrite reductase/ring-hydroxylating ferredoxin subunit
VPEQEPDLSGFRPWIEAPWVRSVSIGRLLVLVDRYRAMTEPGAGGGAPFWTEELERSTTDDLSRRLAASEGELHRLRAAAPFPPPDDRIDRWAALARADLVWLLDALTARRRGQPVPELGAGEPPPGGIFDLAVRLVKSRVPLQQAEICSLLGSAPCAENSAAQDELRVIHAADLQEDRGQRVCAFGEEIALFRRGGRVFAVGAVCPHRQGPLDQGWIRDGAIVCPHHGWCFDLETGARVGAPATRIPVYEVREDRGELLLKKKPR